MYSTECHSSNKNASHNNAKTADNESAALLGFTELYSKFQHIV